MNKATQKSQVLRHLQSRGSLTTMTAFAKYRITRVSERIRELEREGHLINHAWIERGGKRYVAYSLVECGKRAA